MRRLAVPITLILLSIYWVHHRILMRRPRIGTMRWIDDPADLPQPVQDAFASMRAELDEHHVEPLSTFALAFPWNSFCQPHAIAAGDFVITLCTVIVERAKEPISGESWIELVSIIDRPDRRRMALCTRRPAHGNQAFPNIDFEEDTTIAVRDVDPGTPLQSFIDTHRAYVAETQGSIVKVNRSNYRRTYDEMTEREMQQSPFRFLP